MWINDVLWLFCSTYYQSDYVHFYYLHYEYAAINTSFHIWHLSSNIRQPHGVLSHRAEMTLENTVKPSMDLPQWSPTARASEGCGTTMISVLVGSRVEASVALWETDASLQQVHLRPLSSITRWAWYWKKSFFMTLWMSFSHTCVTPAAHFWEIFLLLWRLVCFCLNVCVMWRSRWNLQQESPGLSSCPYILDSLTSPLCVLKDN